MEKHLHFKDEKSDKFWKIKVENDAHTVTYGRAGSAGTSKTKTFESDVFAQKDAERLLKAKLKKGYIEVGSAQNKPAHSQNKSAQVQDEPAPARLESKPVVNYVHGQPFDVFKMAPRIAANPHDDENKSWSEKFREYLLVQDSAATTHFVAGIACEAYDVSNTDVVLKSLVEHKQALPNLVSLFLNDIGSEECELSWLIEGDLRPVWEHFPNLIEFKVRGYPGEMGKISMPKLERFTIECSGMKRKNLEQLFNADMPSLTHLELWVGTDEYGGETTPGDWEPLLSGKLFPKLKYLGLRNCSYADELAQIVANAPILDRIETLDMSLGTMGDEGATALYQSNRVRSLKHLDLHHHFMSDWMVGRFLGVNKPAPTPKRPETKIEMPTPAPVKSGGFLSKVFGKTDTPPPPPPPVPTETESSKSKIDYANIPLIGSGEFGPTVNTEEQEDAYEYDEEGWRYVAFGE